jgi:PAS domain-containing protein
LGSLAAVLPFNARMDAVSNPDDLASSPIAIVVAAEAVAVLMFGLSGSLVDNRVEARDRPETDRFRQLADSTLEGILIHRDGQILDGNVSLAALLGIELTELRNSPLTRFVAPNGNAEVWSLKQNLRTGLQHNEFMLHLQLIFDRNIMLVAFGTLVRWSRPPLGPVPLGQFIPLGEQCGFIVPRGEWIMRTACTAAMSSNHGCRVAVNLSPAQFERSDVRAMVAVILAKTGLPPDRLELEIH